MQIYCLEEKENSVPSSTHTLQILDIDETIHPIDPKFLPKGGVGYTELETVYQFDSVNMNYDSNRGNYHVELRENIPALLPGRTYVVNFGGKDYICTSFVVEIFICLGNYSMTDSNQTDTGEPFFITIYGDGSYANVWTASKMDFVICEEVARKIDSKFIPGVLAEINTADHGFTIFGAEDPAAITFPNSFVEAITKHSDTGNPFILVYDIGDGSVVKVLLSSALSIAGLGGVYSGIFMMESPQIITLQCVMGSCAVTLTPLAAAGMSE
jgi:hypothetical protein